MRGAGAHAGLALAAGAGTWAAYTWGAHLLARGATRRGGAEGRLIALTFDDGPDPLWTPRVLDLLEARGLRATFFVVGERAVRAPDVLRRMALAGHEIASHGWSHASLWGCGPARTRREVERAHAAIAGLTGRPPRLFRPPWGMVNAAVFAAVRAAGERLVLWSLQPEGLRPVSAARQAMRVIGRAHPGAVVDLHDAEGLPGAPARVCAALPPMIDGLRAAGYTLTTASDVLGAGGGRESGRTPGPR